MLIKNARFYILSLLRVPSSVRDLVKHGYKDMIFYRLTHLDTSRIFTSLRVP